MSRPNVRKNRVGRSFTKEDAHSFPTMDEIVKQAITKKDYSSIPVINTMPMTQTSEEPAHKCLSCTKKNVISGRCLALTENIGLRRECWAWTNDPLWMRRYGWQKS